MNQPTMNTNRQLNEAWKKFATRVAGVREKVTSLLRATEQEQRDREIAAIHQRIQQ